VTGLIVVAYLLVGLTGAKLVAPRVQRARYCERCAANRRGDSRSYCSTHLTETGASGYPQALAAALVVILAWPVALYVAWLFLPPGPDRQQRRREAAEANIRRLEKELRDGAG
jgi:hypothetical protein